MATRHAFLNKLMTTKVNEDLSYKNAINCGVGVTAGILSCCLLEVASYFIYCHKVRTGDRDLTYADKINFSYILGEKF